MAIKTFGSRGFDCIDAVEPCSRVLLINTSFVGNSASLPGSAIIATRLNHILVACERFYEVYNLSRFLSVAEIMYFQGKKTLVTINNSSSPCKSWKHNGHVGSASEEVIGTFGVQLNLTTNSTHGSKISGANGSGFVLHNVQSGAALPTIIVIAVGASKKTIAPTLHTDAIVVSSSNGFLNRSIGLAFENGTCIMNNIVSFVKPGKYVLQLKPRYDDDILEATNLTILIRKCTLNEVSALDGKICLQCGEASYNFDLARKQVCVPCPENANCSTRYIKPKDGYWHKSPCHAKVKKCIVDKACQGQDRLEELDNFTRGFDNCNMSDGALSNYNKAQCHEVNMHIFTKDFSQKHIASRVMKVRCVEVVRNLMDFHQVSSARSVVLSYCRFCH